MKRKTLLLPFIIYSSNIKYFGDYIQLYTIYIKQKPDND